ncbi:translation initiation factor 2 [Jejuia pallidilutea]|uniref:Translation initiation factor 2 n=1 Tax=Jejuia pallidilutea TaxID=504487 RepID=A0A090W235_9FLAO|nr:translation initiation factor 2 [Jejuia pallidilutea]
MADTIRLNKVLRELNISLDRAVEFLDSKGIEIEKRPTTKISEETYNILSDEFETDANKKMRSQEVSEAKLKEKEDLRIKREKELEEKQKAKEAIEKAQQEEVVKASKTLSGPKTVGKIDLEPKKKVQETPAPKEVKKVEEVKEVKKRDCQT